MLLRGSGRHTGNDYDLAAMVAEDGAGGGVAAGEALARYADTFFEHGRAVFPAARDRLHEEVGGAALVDAAGVLAIFNAVVRIADATGIPLEDEKNRISADFRDALGINDYPAADGKVWDWLPAHAGRRADSLDGA